MISVREAPCRDADAWLVQDSIEPGYEVSFTRRFYKPKTLRMQEEIQVDILALEKETEGLVDELVGKEI